LRLALVHVVPVPAARGFAASKSRMGSQIEGCHREATIVSGRSDRTHRGGMGATEPSDLAKRKVREVR
jgi:hypothetical protein